MFGQRQTYVLSTGKKTTHRCFSHERLITTCRSSLSAVCGIFNTCSGYLCLENVLVDDRRDSYQRTSMDVGACRYLPDTSDYVGSEQLTKERAILDQSITSSGINRSGHEEISGGSKTTQLKFCVWEMNAEAGEYDLNMIGDDIVKHQGRVYPDSTIAIIYKKDCRSYLWKRSGKTTPGPLEEDY